MYMCVYVHVAFNYGALSTIRRYRGRSGGLYTSRIAQRSSTESGLAWIREHGPCTHSREEASIVDQLMVEETGLPTSVMYNPAHGRWVSIIWPEPLKVVEALCFGSPTG